MPAEERRTLPVPSPDCRARSCLHGERAAECIEPKTGLDPEISETVEIAIRDQVPVDRIAEGFVDAHAIEYTESPSGVPSNGDAVKP